MALIRTFKTGISPFHLSLHDAHQYVYSSSPSEVLSSAKDCLSLLSHLHLVPGHDYNLDYAELLNGYREHMEEEIKNVQDRLHGLPYLILAIII
jgi:hypothetical protein